jgi:hypothetical protein
MKEIYLFLLIGFSFFTGKAQAISVLELVQNVSQQSLYSICKVGVDSMLAVGKEGVSFYIIKDNNNWKIVENKNEAHQTFFDVCVHKNKFVVAADNASICLQSNSTETKKTRSNEKLANYCVASINEQMIVGGMCTKIANGKKVIPCGFISILDSEANVVDTKKFVGSAIWDVFSNQQQQAFALKYNLLGTSVLKQKVRKWKKVNHYSALLHKAILLPNNSFAFCGTNNFRSKFGVVQMNNKRYELPTTDVVWSLCQLQNTLIASGSYGILFYKKNDDALFSNTVVNRKVRIYDIAKLDNSTAIAVGQLGKIYLITEK